MPSRIRIGDRIKDSISGFAGIATGKCEYINGCRQWLIKPDSLDKDGKMIDGVWIDEQHVEVVKSQVLPEPTAFAADLNKAAVLTGGPGDRVRPQTSRHQ